MALENKLTLVNAGDGTRILPAYYSDNYVSLLPGESKEIEIEFPAAAAKGQRRWDSGMEFDADEGRGEVGDYSPRGTERAERGQECPRHTSELQIPRGLRPLVMTRTKSAVLCASVSLW